MPLKKEHAVIITSDWNNRGSEEDMRSYFSSVIENFDSSCLVDDQDRLLAYVCMHYNGSMAMVYVRPEYRKEGYFHLLLSDLTRKILAKKDIAYGFIPINDTSLINLCREIGFEWVPQGNMTWSRYSRYSPRATRLIDQTAQQSNVANSVDELSTSVSNLLINAMVYPWGLYFFKRVIVALRWPESDLSTYRTQCLSIFVKVDICSNLCFHILANIKNCRCSSKSANVQIISCYFIFIHIHFVNFIFVACYYKL